MVRIARFTTGDDPRFGLVTGDVDDHGIPDEDSLITALAGDPLYVGLQPTDEQVVPRDHGQQTAIVRSIIGMGHLQLILHP